MLRAISHTKALLATCLLCVPDTQLRLMVSVAPGYKLDGPAFHTLFNAYNPERNGTMDLTEFIAMTLFLQSANATFTAFDQQRMGRVTLDYNQFIYAAANIV